jgi:hypothetical protein
VRCMQKKEGPSGGEEPARTVKESGGQRCLWDPRLGMGRDTECGRWLPRCRALSGQERRQTNIVLGGGTQGETEGVGSSERSTEATQAAADQARTAEMRGAEPKLC